MQHQFWLTKKTVQRKLGTREDEHIISSDAELDSKLELFKSISDTSAELSRAVHLYQERLLLLSQEECDFGRFLKEAGKRSKTTSSSITNTGKAISYSGQQRMCVRVPLLRLHHEVEMFRCHAVRDTQLTVNAMEKERTEYRAALAWMKSASSELDPDTGRGLDKFRTAQSQVRNSKQNFDIASLNSIQKIDLLAAARCNMYSHALVSYMSELLQFAKKTTSVFDAISSAIQESPRYDFCVLKELSQDDSNVDEAKEAETLDVDQALFFADDYTDNERRPDNEKRESPALPTSELHELTLHEVVNDLVPCLSPVHTNSKDELSTFAMWEKSFLASPDTDEASAAPYGDDSIASGSNTMASGIAKPAALIASKANDEKPMPADVKKLHSWIDYFAELDPLTNLEEFDMKLSGGKINSQKT